jgi:hypothetical protein
MRNGIFAELTCAVDARIKTVVETGGSGWCVVDALFRVRRAGCVCACDWTVLEVLRFMLKGWTAVIGWNCVLHGLK